MKFELVINSRPQRSSVSRSLTHTNCTRPQYTTEPILTDQSVFFLGERVMRLVYRSLTYSIAVLLNMSAGSSYAAKLTLQVSPADSTIMFDNSTSSIDPAWRWLPAAMTWLSPVTAKSPLGAR